MYLNKSIGKLFIKSFSKNALHPREEKEWPDFFDVS